MAVHAPSPDLGAVNLSVQNDSLSSSITGRVLSSYFWVTVWKYDSYQLGQDKLCSIKFKEALFKDTAVLTRLDQKHVGYGSRERERAGECLDRGERLGLTAILPPPPTQYRAVPGLAYHQPLASVHPRLV